MGGAITKAPLGGDDTSPYPTDRSKSEVKRSVLTEGHGIPMELEVKGAMVMQPYRRAWVAGPRSGSLRRGLARGLVPQDRRLLPGEGTWGRGGSLSGIGFS
jgi:hypothetical protein